MLKYSFVFVNVFDIVMLNYFLNYWILLQTQVGKRNRYTVTFLI